MTPVVKWIRDTVERAFGRFYEGPTPPERLKRLVVVFGNKYRHATRNDWARFAMKHAEEAYKAGYVRGYEYTERDREWPHKFPPDLLADMYDPDWKWRPVESEILEAPEEIVEDTIGVIDLQAFEEMPEPEDEERMG